MIKKLLLVLGLASVLNTAQAGIIVSNNIAAGSQVVYTGQKRVYQIVAFGATANSLGFYDSQYSSNAYTQPAFSYNTNLTISVTNLTTNGIFVYDTTTQYMIQTNIFVRGNFSSNVSVNAAVREAPFATLVPVIAGAITTVPNLDLIFLKGITITATNNATVMIYTQD